jgi:hypothetical protein
MSAINPLRKSHLLFAIVVAMVVAPLALAHHSTAMFDMQKTVEITGTIKEFQWTNPHTMTYVVVEGDADVAGEYALEGMSPNYLGREGWSRHTLKPGDKVSLQVHPLKDGRKGGFMVSVTLPDGKVMHNLPSHGGVDPSKAP